jgi:hypothetical protein
MPSLSPAINKKPAALYWDTHGRDALRFLSSSQHRGVNWKGKINGPRHQQALTYLGYGHVEGVGFIVLTGEMGTARRRLSVPSSRTRSPTFSRPWSSTPTSPQATW